MINKKACFTSNSDEWATPIQLFNDLNNIYHFTLDPCASLLNHKCDNYFTIDDNGILKDWSNNVVFCNPPYSSLKLWCRKCAHEYLKNNITIVLLIPSRTDTSYFHDYVLPFAEIYFIRGRLHFNESKNSAPFPSLIAVYRKK